MVPGSQRALPLAHNVLVVTPRKSLFFLKILGEPALRGPGGPVSGRAAYKRRIALLAILALARGRPVGRERLLGLLWPEHPASGARRLLTESLHVLRRELGDDVFATPGDEVALNPAVVLSDVEEFESAAGAGEAERAAAAYGGPLLHGFEVEDAPGFERWAADERARLGGLYARVVEELAGQAEREGSALRAVDWWRRLAAHDPLSSRVALGLVRALEAAGERGAALRAAETHAALLREELGLENGGELAALVERLRSEPSPAPPLPTPPAAPPPPVLVADEGGEAREEPAPPPSPLPVADVPAPPALPRRVGWVAAAAGVALAALAVALGWPRGGEAPAAGGPDPRRIAVLYLDDHSPGGELGYLAGGLTEMLIHELAQVEALDVVSRNGVKPYRDGRVPLDSVARALRVGSLVEGSVQRAGDSVRVVVQLIDAATLSHLESRSVTRSAADVLALEDALAAEVAASLRRRLGERVRLSEAERETASAAAREGVMRARQATEEATRLEGSGEPAASGPALGALLRADSLLALAERADPRWAAPTTERGWVAFRRGSRERGARRDGLFATARGHARRVLERHPGDARALELSGTVHWISGVTRPGGAAAAALLDSAEHDLRGAVAGDPSLAGAWASLAQLLLFRGRFAEAGVAAARALEEDAWLAEGPGILHQLFAAALASGDPPAARAHCQEGRRRFPGDWRFAECRLALMREDPAEPPDPALAWRLVAELDRLDPPAAAHASGRGYSPLYRRVLAAAVLARAGADDSARAVLARARRAAADDESRLSLDYDEASVRLLLGETPEARRLLARYLAARPAMRPFAERDPLVRGALTPASPPASRPGSPGTPAPAPG